MVRRILRAVGPFRPKALPKCAQRRIRNTTSFFHGFGIDSGCHFGAILKVLLRKEDVSMYFSYPIYGFHGDSMRAHLWAQLSMTHNQGTILQDPSSLCNGQASSTWYIRGFSYCSSYLLSSFLFRLQQSGFGQKYCLPGPASKAFFPL